MYFSILGQSKEEAKRGTEKSSKLSKEVKSLQSSLKSMEEEHQKALVSSYIVHFFKKFELYNNLILINSYHMQWDSEIHCLGVSYRNSLFLVV